MHEGRKIPDFKNRRRIKPKKVKKRECTPTSSKPNKYFSDSSKKVFLVRNVDLDRSFNLSIICCYVWNVFPNDFFH